MYVHLCKYVWGRSLYIYFGIVTALSYITKKGCIKTDGERNKDHSSKFGLARYSSERGESFHTKAHTATALAILKAWLENKKISFSRLSALHAFPFHLSGEESRGSAFLPTTRLSCVLRCITLRE